MHSCHIKKEIKCIQKALLLSTSKALNASVSVTGSVCTEAFLIRSDGHMSILLGFFIAPTS